ncbi:MAG: SpoIIE family protein phosphatase [Candidatus Eremiobacteraeota bacterium]|nr:SpoIIE family protein phosphatase [Candidatus Eremiobacteraeota bacterium]
MLEPRTSRHVEPLDLLAEASGILASSFDVRQTLPQIVELCVREFADLCSINIRRLDGLRETHEAARDERSGESGLDSLIAVPLCGRNEILGTLALGAAEPEAFDSQTQKLATVLAVLIANALDQSALFERTHRVADRLQRALLPEKFPTIDGATLHGSYRPASDESEVGGDWYDAFTLPDGRIALSLGDVAGHGLEAATIMGEIRQAIRSVGTGAPEPSDVLEHINNVINLRSTIGMVTAIFGYYDPTSRCLTYAVAGHPPPIVTLAHGVSALLPGGGVPLGVAPSIDAVNCRITLPPESQIIFYTDGLTEYGRDVLAGEELLLAAACSPAVRAAENPAEKLQEEIFATALNRDDAAVLTIRCAGGAVPSRLHFSSVPIVAPLVRAWMDHVADVCVFSDEQRFALLLATGEAVANAVEHAYRGDMRGEITVHTEITPEALVVQVEDRGRWRPFQKRDERGRGITLMHQLVDGVRITSTQSSTIVSLTMSRHAAA